ncbi:MAG: hypothetical protein KF850_33985 [Labilithrix sp.]|nr:hypothetical protein [Labilithrix sp.]
MPSIDASPASPPPRRRRPAPWALVAVLGVAHRANAEGPRAPAEREDEHVQLAYEAAERCPRYEAFLDNVRVYTTRWTLVTRGGRHLRVTLEPRDAAVVGTLEAPQGPGAPPDEVAPRAVREIVGPDCETVARAMAVAVAVAIDPRVFGGGDDDAPEVAPPAPGETATTAEPPAPRTSPRPERRSPSPAAPRRRLPRLSLEARAELTSAVIARVLPVVGVAAELDPFAESSAQPSWPAPRWLRPSFALGIRQGLPTEVTSSDVVTTFTWTSGVARLCPARLASRDGRLEVVPCLEGDAGVLRADAAGAFDARRTTNLWLDAGASARLSWTPAAPWFVGAALAALVPVTRNRFELTDRTLVSRAPRLGVTLGLTAGVRF